MERALQRAALRRVLERPAEAQTPDASGSRICRPQDRAALKPTLPELPTLSGQLPKAASEKVKESSGRGPAHHRRIRAAVIYFTISSYPAAGSESWTRSGGSRPGQSPSSSRRNPPLRPDGADTSEQRLGRLRRLPSDGGSIAIRIGVTIGIARPTWRCPIDAPAQRRWSSGTWCGDQAVGREEVWTPPRSGAGVGADGP